MLFNVFCGIWHGWATKTITASDRKQPDELIMKAVDEIFKSFTSVLSSQN
jgi:hypothetical protein